jgi:glycosyltransferase involved in cell wall biosynthesis
MMVGTMADRLSVPSAPRKTIASCIDSMATAGGTELHAIRLCEALASAGVRVHCFTLNAAGEMARRYRDAGIEVFALPIRSLASADLFRAARLMAHRCQVLGVEVIHAHDSYSNLVASIAARLAKLPMLASKRWTSYRWRQHRYTDRIAFGLASGILVNDMQVFETLGASSRRKARVVRNSVADEVFAAHLHRDALRRSWGIDRDALVITMVAMMRPEKAHEVLLEAFARLYQVHPAARLVLVGDGPTLSSVAAQVADRHLQDAVVIVGRMADAWRAFGAADIAVLCSRHEGSPNAILEAMAAGLPVVGTAVGGIPSLVANEISGLLVPADNPTALADALIRLSESAVQRTALGAAGRRIASGHHSITSAIEQHLAWYDELST